MSSTGVRAIGYRADIDGLRAVAVLSVVAFHLEPSWAPGGYVGVDVFFVISGYLITGILWRALSEGRFSFADFYVRRIRRILPAFLVMTAATMLAGVLLLLPSDLEMLARSARSAALSAGNIFYWRHLDVSYFATSSDEQPLLHTWSLGVEEQFYLLWPALLAVLCVAGRRRTALALSVACAIAVASFWIAEATVVAQPKFAYFMLPARAGELMLGAIIALALNAREPTPATTGTRWLHEAIATIGAALIAYAIFAFDSDTRFPGLHALVPAMGASLLILSGSRSKAALALLARRPIVLVGLMSYSLYLWHWPVLAYLRYFYRDLTLLQLGIAMLAILALSLLSYRYVEQPGRHARAPKWRQAATFAVVPIMALAAISVALIRTDGLAAFRDGSRLQAMEDTAPAYVYPENCQLQAFDPTILQQARCVTPAGARAHAVLWGDSHAAHYLGATLAVAREEGIAIRNASLSACPPVFGGHYGSEQFGKGCDEFRDFMRRYLQSGAAEVVILGATWSSYDSAQFRSDLDTTVRTLRASGMQVVLLEEVPAFVGYQRQCESRWAALPAPNPCSRTSADAPGPSNDFLHALATQQAAFYLGVRSILCTAGACSTRLDGKNVYFDANHLSMAGSRSIGAHLLRSSQADAWRRALAGSAPASGGSNASVSSALPQ